MDDPEWNAVVERLAKARGAMQRVLAYRMREDLALIGAKVDDDLLMVCAGVAISYGEMVKDKLRG